MDTFGEMHSVRLVLSKRKKVTEFVKKVEIGMESK